MGKRKRIYRKKAKEGGSWNEFGLDSNNHLFKEADKNAKIKLDKIRLMID